MTSSLLELDNVTKRFGRVVIAEDLSFAVGPGDVVGIVGPNGAGKTSLFGLISGDLAPGAALAKTLVDDVHLLRAKVETASITVEGLVTGAVELLNEVSKSKVTGEEERYSHTDLWDFQANVDGSAQIWSLLKPGVTPADPTLSQTIDQRLAALQSLLETHKRGTGFVLYGELKPDEVKALSAAVDGLAEPLSQLGALAGSPKP